MNLKLILLPAILLLALSGCGTFFDKLSPAHIKTQTSTMKPIRAWFFSTVGVQDLGSALTLWRDQFGFDVIYGSQDQSRDLEKLWDLPEGEIVDHATIAQEGMPHSKLLLVEYKNPLPPVRQGAKLEDSLPKNIDVYANDLDTQVNTLRQAGYAFRSAEPQSFVTDGQTIREIHMPAHDETNIVILERADLPLSYNAKGYFGIGMIIVTVPDIDREQLFLQNLLALELVTDVELAGPELEAVTGLPQGTQWLIKILGEPGFFGGQIEIVEYRGVEGSNRYHRAQPGALGLTGVTYEVADLDASIARLDKINHDYETKTGIALDGQCYDALRLRTPAGMPLQLFGSSNICTSVP